MLKRSIIYKIVFFMDDTQSRLVMNLRLQGCDGASNTGIPQTRRKRIIDPNDISAQIEITIREFEKGRSTKKIAEKYGLDPELTEHIIRLYVTHPGVTVDGIMTKMGL